MSEKKDLKVAPEAKALPDEALEGVVGGTGPSEDEIKAKTQADIVQTRNELEDELRNEVLQQSTPDSFKELKDELDKVLRTSSDLV